MMSRTTTPIREVGMVVVVALCAAIIGVGFLADSADAFRVLPGDNVQQSPVAGDPQCSDLFPGSSQVRSDAPGPDVNPTGTVPARQLPPIDGFDELVGVVVHGGASGSNVYDSSTGMTGRLIATLNPGGGLARVQHTLICYTVHQDTTSSTGTVTLVYSDSGHHVAVSVAISVPPTTTTSPEAAPTTTMQTEAVVTTTTVAAVPPTVPTEVLPATTTPTTTVAVVPATTIPDDVIDQVVPTQTPVPVVAQPTFTG